MPINLNSLQTVMLVDDDAATNFIHEQFIREAGFSGTIQAFQRADEAAEHLAMHRPQILFLDLFDVYPAPLRRVDDDAER